MPKADNSAKGFHNTIQRQLQMCILVFWKLIVLLIKEKILAKKKKLINKNLKKHDTNSGDESTSTKNCILGIKDFEDKRLGMFCRSRNKISICAVLLCNYTKHFECTLTFYTLQ